MRSNRLISPLHSQLLVLLMALLAMPLALADSYKRMTLEIDSAGFDNIKLEMSIGEMDVEIYDGDTIQLEIELEANRNWFSFRRGNVDNIELEQRPRGDTLYLGIDKDNIEQTWYVRMPARLALDVEVGVGDVGIEGLDNNLSLDLGVGAASVDTAGDNYREISASSGVGDAVIRGFSRGADNERRALVGADAWYEGDGEYSIHVEVGVGDAQIRRR